MKYRWWLVITIGIFAVSIVIGLSRPTMELGSVSGEADALQQLAKIIAALPPLLGVLLIFIKNLMSLVLSFIFSPILCLMPLFTLAANGWLIGVVSNSVVQGKSLGYLLAGILPHGIFEIPAFIMGEAVALAFGVAVMTALIKRHNKPIVATIKANIKYLAIAAILLVPAAFIEVLVTPLFLPK
jgi:stage II sporulation protein M